MKKTWGRLFRRKSAIEAELKEDFPTYSESDVTDDDRRREEWQQYLNRQAANAKQQVPDETEQDEQWEYESEYNVSFASDTSIIDAFKERKSDDRYYIDEEFEDYKEKVDRDGFMYENERPDRLRDIRKQSIFKTEDDHDKGPQNGLKTHIKNMVSDRVKSMEQRLFDRGYTTFSPSTKAHAQKQMRRKSGATWNDCTVKKKVRKQAKQRKRARGNVSEISDDDNDPSKFTVNISMADLNNLIKKNINSAVKTIVSAASHGKGGGLRPISPSESFSTETETIFSGSSSHSTDHPIGLINKQIKAQLDKDLLKGIRKASTAIAPGLLPETTPEATQHRSVSPQIHISSPSPLNSNNIAQPAYHLNSIQHQHPMQHQAQQNPNFHNVIQQNEQQQPQFITPMTQQPPPAIPQAPPPPPPPPQVTFNIPEQHIMRRGTEPYAHNDHIHPQSNPTRRASVIPGFGDLMDPFGYNQGQDGIANPFGTTTGMTPGALNRLRNRRHTLAAISDESMSAAMNNGFDTKMEQLSNVLGLLNNANKERAEKTEVKEGVKETGKDSEANEVKPTTDSTTQKTEAAQPNILAPVLSIAEQIQALTKKKAAKPLKEGQIRMSGCARAMLVLTNIIFMVIGGGLAGLGVWMMMDPNIETYFILLNVDQDSADFSMICYVLIAIGVFVLAISFIGCCGALKSSKCMLTMFIIIIAIMTVMEVGIGALVFMNIDSPSAIPVLSAFFQNLESSLKEVLKRSVVEKYAPDTLIGTTWDMVQKELDCCGSSGPGDYEISAWKNDTLNELTIPLTCCVLLSKTDEIPEPSNKLLCQVLTIGFFHDTGCYDRTIGWFKERSTFILAGAATAVGIEVFAFISALIICRKAIADEEKRKQKQKDKPNPPS